MRGTARTIALGILFVVFSSLGSSARPPFYRVVDLGTLGGSYFDVLGLSEAGHVVGWSATGAVDVHGWPVRHAFLWYDGEMKDLGTLEGPLGNSEARAVNSSGHAVGWSSVGSQYHAVLWLPEPAFGLPAGINDLNAPGEYDASASGINERSEIVGASDEAIFLWLPNPAFGMDAGINALCVYELGSTFECPVFSNAAINDAGQVAAGGALWLPWPAYGRTPGWSDYWFRGGDGTYVALEISASGLVVGNFLDGLKQGAKSYVLYWLTEDRGERSPFQPRVFVNGSNEFDDIVGGGSIEGELAGLLRRGAYTGEGFLDLNDLLVYSDGWSVLWGSDINNVGQIAGGGYLIEDEIRPVLLQPVRPDLDRSGRVDLDDVSELAWCLAGPFAEPDYDCMVADLESDLDVDLKDFQALQLGFEGSN